MHDSNEGRIRSIRDQLVAVYQGNNWVTDGMMQRFAVLNEEQINEPLPYLKHNLPQLIHHIIAWKVFVIKRLQGDNVYDINQDSELDWPAPGSWKETLELLRKTQENLLSAVDKFDPGNLDSKVAGRSYTFNFMLQGLVHHDYYHYGQAGMIASALAGKENQDANPLV